MIPGNLHRGELPICKKHSTILITPKIGYLKPITECSLAFSEFLQWLFSAIYILRCRFNRPHHYKYPEFRIFKITVLF